MSERGSFCTEYIYCQDCFAAVKSVMVEWKSLDGVPIIAGKIIGLSSGEEIWSFPTDYGEDIAATICHDVRIAVLADSGASEIFLLKPGGLVERLLSRGSTKE